MNTIYLDNGVKLIYKKCEGSLTSFCIGFDAGADKDLEEHYGLAHAVEHMVYKGTTTKSEEEINEKIDELFGFSNAMTNYPYVVFYGTCLNEDFKEGFMLHADMLINPIFSEDGFKEEMDVIKEELKEWSEDSYQHCEDLCLKHGFRKRRIRDLIIGNCETLDKITLNHIKKFHEDYYIGNNCVVSVISSLDLNIIIDTVKISLKKMRWGNDSEIRANELKDDVYEPNVSGVFRDCTGCGNCKISFVYPFNNLTSEEIITLKVFNNIFAEGVSSLLYNEIRTKRGLSYEVGAKIKEEKGIKLYKIYLGTSSENADTAVKLICQLISRIKDGDYVIDSECIKKAIKSVKLKLSIDLEKSIIHSFRLCAMEFNESPLYYDEEVLEKINEKTIRYVVKKVFTEPTIEIMT